MRVIITGSRNLYPQEHTLKIVAELITRAFPDDLRIVHGCCPRMRSVDWTFDEAGMELQAEVEQFHPEQYGKWPGCGPKRNTDMVRYGADLGIAYHDNLENSRGTLDCVRKMIQAGIPVDWYRGADHPPDRILDVDPFGRNIILDRVQGQRKGQVIWSPEID
jgi:hypothetical protein